MACSNKSRTREAPTPTNISTKSEPLILKNGTPASPATAFASKVLPVPGGPNNKTPFGILAPNSLNFFGCFKNSTTSSSSCLASSAPATSLKVIFTFSSPYILALLLPKDITRPPPPWLCCISKNQIPTISSIGKIEEIIFIHHGGCGGNSALISTSWLRSV